MIDQATAHKKDLQVGQTIGVQANGPTLRMKISGLVHFGGAASLGGATLSGFDLPTGQRLFERVGKLDQIRAKAKAGVSPAKLAAEIRAVLPPGTQVKTGAAAGEVGREGHRELPQLPAGLPARVRRDRALRRLVRDRELALDHDRAADARARDAADARRVATPGAASRSSSRRFVIGSLASVVGIVVGLGLGVGLFKLFDAVGFTLPNNGLVLHTRTVDRRAHRRDPRHRPGEPPPRRRARRACRRSRPCARAPSCRRGGSRKYRPVGSALLTVGRVRAAHLRPVRQRPRDEADPPLHGPRDAADLHRRRAPRGRGSCARSPGRWARRRAGSAARPARSPATTRGGTRSGRLPPPRR